MWQHDGNVARSGRTCAAGGIGIDLDRDRRRRKAAALKRPACRFRVAHEMADMIEKNLIAGRKPAVDLALCGRAGQAGYALPAMPAASTTLPQRSISDSKNFCRSGTDFLPIGIMPRSFIRASTSSMAT